MPINASELTAQQQITAVYVAYYDRAPDPRGLDFWTGQLEGGRSLEQIATDFSGAAETQEKYPFFADETGSADAFITSIYGNLFGRTPDAEGLAFWSEQLESGSTPVGEIILAILEGAQDEASGGSPDSETITNKIDVGLDWATKAGAAGLDTDTAIAEEIDGELVINNQAAFDSATSVLEGVDGTPESVDAAKAQTDAFIGGGAGATDLGGALAALSAAQEARAEFLAGEALENEGVAELAGEDAETATEGNVTTHYGNTAGEVNTQLGLVEDDDDAVGVFDVNNFEARSASVQDAAIADGVAQAEANVADAEDAVVDGVLPALDSVQARIGDLEEAISAEAAAEQTFNGELARFNNVNAAADTITLNSGALPKDDDTLTVDVEGNAVTVATYTDGSWVVEEGFDSDGLNGFDALIADANTWGAAVESLADANNALSEAALDVVQLEADNEEATLPAGVVTAPTDGSVEPGADFTVEVDFTAGAPTGDPVDPAAPDAAAVLNARETLDNLNEAVAEFEPARELVADLDGLDDAIEAATLALTNDEDDDPAGLGVALREADDNFTAEDDVYLFNEDESAGESLSGFGADGEDNIFFGDGFSLVQIPEGNDISDNVGDANALEVLWEQDGTDLVLYVESETFGGNSSVTAEVTQVTLTGVSADDVTFENGFLSSGTVEVA